jgi:hypothetical protein
MYSLGWAGVSANASAATRTAAVDIILKKSLDLLNRTTRNFSFHHRIKLSSVISQVSEVEKNLLQI